MTITRIALMIWLTAAVSQGREIEQNITLRLRFGTADPRGRTTRARGIRERAPACLLRRFCQAKTLISNHHQGTEKENKPMRHNMKNYDSKWGARRLFIGALVFGCAACAIPRVYAQTVASPSTPAIITPPPGNAAFLMGQAVGTQGYICLPTIAGASTASWTVKSSRPDATLFQRVFGLDIQIITHFLSPDANPNDAAPSPLPFGSATW